LPYESQYDSIERLRLLLKKGYWIHCVSHPTTTNGVKCTSLELLKSNIKLEKEVYLITTFDEEADALSEFIGILIPSD
jgi:hypothetical protein